MITVNKVFLLGKLARDPELRLTPYEVPLAEFPLVLRTWRMDEREPLGSAEFVPVEVWRNQGRLCLERLRKGSLLHVEGHLKQKRWLDRKSRKQHSRLVVVATRISILPDPHVSTRPSPSPAAHEPPSPELTDYADEDPLADAY